MGVFKPAITGNTPCECRDQQRYHGGANQRCGLCGYEDNGCLKFRPDEQWIRAERFKDLLLCRDMILKGPPLGDRNEYLHSPLKKDIDALLGAK